MGDLPTRGQISVGDPVHVETKKNQGTGRLVQGLVAEILTSSESHPHGIKVRLEDGQVGRVKRTGSGGDPAGFVDLTKIEIPQVEDASHEFKKYYQYDDRMAGLPAGPESKKAIEGMKRSAQRRIAEAVAGMANSYSGGFLYIGVDDKGVVCGLGRDLEFGSFGNYSDDLANHLNTRLLEYLADKVFISTKVQIAFRDEDGLTICIIQVLPADRPIHLHAGKDELFFVRGPAPRLQRLTVTEQLDYIRTRFPGT